MNAPAPCSDDPDLFRSIKRADHDQARILCVTCPLHHMCRELAADDGQAHGTYAGQLFKKGQLVQLETKAGCAPVWSS